MTQCILVIIISLQLSDGLIIPQTKKMGLSIFSIMMYNKISGML